MMTFRHCLYLIVAASLFAGCGATSQTSKLTEETQARISNTRASAGFLGDYSMLRKGEGDEAMLVYRNPTVDWTSYDKVKLDPVTIWRGGDSPLKDVPEEELQHLANELGSQLNAALKKDYQMVNQAGPGVLHLQVAITEASKSNPAGDILTTINPITRVASGGKKVASGTEAFVGKASVEGKITDAQSGTLLLAAVDRRGGGKYLWKGINKWKDVEKAYEYWAKKLQWRLCDLRGGKDCKKP